MNKTSIEWTNYTSNLIRAGRDMSEWPEDLRVREFPR